MVLREVGVDNLDRRWAAAALLAALLWAAALVAGAPALAQGEWVRDAEPVEVTGEMMGEHRGVPLDELGVYVYVDQAWSPIPFQVDEVDSSGAYTTTEDGLLDDDDVLVLMAGDLGGPAGNEWLSGTETRTEIHVMDPVEPGAEGWAYVYRLPAPEMAADDYVSWNAVLERVEAVSYTLGFSSAVHAGIDSLAFDDPAVDVLDRTKIRVDVTCLVYGFPVEQVTLTEEDLGSVMDPTPRIDGPVRVGGGSAEGSWWYYGQLYETSLVLDTSLLEPPPPCTSLAINSLRLSTDWRDPAVTGMAPAIYYDGNTPDGVAVDGAADGVPEEPVSWWKQVSGARGSLVLVAEAELGGGQVLNYYADDAALDPNDTGDGQSFGDAGFQVIDPAGTAAIGSRVIVLGPSRPNVGEVYAAYYAAPLQVTTVGQRLGFVVYLPVVTR